MRFFISAGEPSGDEHAAHLLREMKLREPELRCDGFGGPEMQKQGCHLLHEMTGNAVMGFLRVIPLLAHFRRLVKRAETYLQDNRPDAVVLVDFPGFNWWIARTAHQLDIPVYYYLPPQLWAWAPWRIRRVRKWVDHVICTLPFEYDWYASRGVNATYVGHPFFDEVADQQLSATTLRTLKTTEENQKVFALLPGSRSQELEHNWPVMLQIAGRVQQAYPGIKWVAGCYRKEHQLRCVELQKKSGLQLNIHYETGQTSEVIETADACLMVSGSVSLELLARRTPGVVLYRTGRIMRFVGRKLVSCRFFTLTNLIADAELMPEILSSGNPTRDIDHISRILIEWAGSTEALNNRRQQLDVLAQKIALSGATARTAELLLAKSPVSQTEDLAA
ncbi:MAG: lipid-A-disaccharide synthase [Fuerstiella sp.]|nr:lipid-A-disaccharide synthase [Fuerstiella sp.]